MLTTQLLTSDQLSLAADMLRTGKLVAFPTDTFFALGAVLTGEAISALFDTKERMAGKPVPVLISSIKSAQQVTGELPSPADALARKFWPGPLTIVAPALPEVPEAVTAGTGTVGIRVPDLDFARELIRQTGRPVTGTSANLSGSAPCRTTSEVLAQLDGRIDAVVDAPCGSHMRPSTVVTFQDGAMSIIRPGAISESELRGALATM